MYRLPRLRSVDLDCFSPREDHDLAAASDYLESGHSYDDWGFPRDEVRHEEALLDMQRYAEFSDFVA